MLAELRAVHLGPFVPTPIVGTDDDVHCEQLYDDRAAPLGQSNVTVLPTLLTDFRYIEHFDVYGASDGEFVQNMTPKGDFGKDDISISKKTVCYYIY